MLAALLVFTADYPPTLVILPANEGAAVPFSPPGAGLDGEHPSRDIGQPYGRGTADSAGAVMTSDVLVGTAVDRADPGLTTNGGYRGTDPRGNYWRPAHSVVAASQFKKVRKRNTVYSVHLEFAGRFRSRRSSETPLPTRDKHLSPVHASALTGEDMGTPFGVLQNVHLFSEKELRPEKATQSSSQSPLEVSASANSGEGLSSSVSEAERGEQPKVSSTTEGVSPPVISTTHRWVMTPRDAGGDTSILSNVSQFQKAEGARADHATHQNITLAYSEYQSSGGARGRPENTAEQLVLTDTKSTQLSSGNAGATVVEVEISKSEMIAAEKETEEIIIKDTTLIIVFSCLAVLVIVVCKIIRYVMDYKLSKYEERIQNTGARPPC